MGRRAQPYRLCFPGPPTPAWPAASLACPPGLEAAHPDRAAAAARAAPGSSVAADLRTITIRHAVPPATAAALAVAAAAVKDSGASSPSQLPGVTASPGGRQPNGQAAAGAAAAPAGVSGRGLGCRFLLLQPTPGHIAALCTLFAAAPNSNPSLDPDPGPAGALAGRQPGLSLGGFPAFGAGLGLGVVVEHGVPLGEGDEEDALGLEAGVEMHWCLPLEAEGRLGCGAVVLGLS